MQKTALIALAIIGTLATGYVVFRHHNKPAAIENFVVDGSVKDVYNQWKVNFNINVGAAEDNYRFGVFSTNYAQIQAHNRLLGRSYNKGLNRFTHLTPEEFSATHLGLNQHVGAFLYRKNISLLSTENLPKSADWRSKMNAVKDQGQCGSCWAFSTVGALEGLHSVKLGNLYNLAEQELVDCSGSYGNNGCNGGLMDNAFKYIIAQGGLATEDAYPYTAADGDCQTVSQRFGKISGFTDVPAGNANALKAALAQQPVSVAIEADTSIFQSYSSGVITSTSCGTQLDHGVVAVGYDTTGRTPYYIVRNSWGTSWGDNGHVNIAIVDGDGICGIQKMASYPTA